MARNAEVKARVTDYESLVKRATELSDTPEVALSQEDTFYHTKSGRLKLRNVDGAGELIYYQRPDTSGPRQCEYEVLRVDYEGMARVLRTALSVRGTVRKQRRLFMRGSTRIHVDRVEGIGDFVELEVVLTPEQSEQEGQRIAEETMGLLGVRAADLVDCAYIDLIERSRAS